MKDTAREIVKSEKQLAQEFQDKYDELCRQYGLVFVVNPVWMKRDDGTFSLVLQMQAAKLPKE
jgi:hypothetical protein